MKKESIGGQAVIEGVMMKSPRRTAMAVRRTDQTISIYTKEYSAASNRNWFLKLPIIRGVVNFVEMMAMGVRMLTKSASMSGLDDIEEEPSKFEKFLAEKTNKSIESIIIFVAVALAIVMAVGLFFLLPSFLAGLFKPLISSNILLNLIEGGFRLAIFLAYMAGVSLMKDIKRTFMYHGAEHKVVNCYEKDLELNVDNARAMSTRNPRCGTNYLLLVMVVSILVISLTGFQGSFLVRAGIRILLLPVVAGVAYEILKLAAKSDILPFRIIRYPGMLLQKLTTREPTDDMLEVSLIAFKRAMGMEENEIPELIKNREEFGEPEQTEDAAEKEETKDRDMETVALQQAAEAGEEEMVAAQGLQQTASGSAEPVAPTPESPETAQKKTITGKGMYDPATQQ